MSSGITVVKIGGSTLGAEDTSLEDVVALAEDFALPVHAVGVGEQPNDLRPFEARAFARGLMGLE